MKTPHEVPLPRFAPPHNSAGTPTKTPHEALLPPAVTTTTTASASRRTPPPPITFGRILQVETRKMFDTRSGFWLMASIGILAVVATGATIIFADRADLTYESFASAVGIPMSVLLPMIAILSVTSEWSQRTGLATFTMIPDRGRVIAAKGAITLAMGVAGMLLALAVGALGNLVGTAIADVDPVWNVSVSAFAQIVLASEIAMMIGFVLGVLLRNSAAGIVGYFVVGFVLPGISSALASTQQWWADHGAWLDINMATFPLYDDTLSGEQWAQLGAAGVIWLVVPLVVGLWTLMRAEVK